MRAQAVVLVAAVMAGGAGGLRSVVPPGSVAAAVPVQQGTAPRMPFGSPAFHSLVEESYAISGVRSLVPFERRLEETYQTAGRARPGASPSTLTLTLNTFKRELASAPTQPQKTMVEIGAAEWAHRAVKSAIPRFSLDRGFEFANAVRFGERQCLLQSVLIAGLLQAAGLDAGVYMVWQNEKGEESNNGHAVAVVRLSDGRDLLVDASDPQPFVRHRGLFVADPAGSGYRFVRPDYDAGSAIVAYGTVSDGSSWRPGAFHALDFTFLRSQFYFYRGERAPGGFLGKPRTEQGLAVSARYLERAQQISPQNPLAVYVLGLVYAKQGRTAAAKKQFARAYGLYSQFGYLPPGPRLAYYAAVR